VPPSAGCSMLPLRGPPLFHPIRSAAPPLPPRYHCLPFFVRLLRCVGFGVFPRFSARATRAQIIRHLAIMFASRSETESGRALRELTAIINVSVPMEGRRGRWARKGD